MKRLAAVLLVCVVAAVGAVLALRGSNSQVATLDGQAISRDELLFQMQRLDRTTSWNGDVARLADLALDEIRSGQATLALAREHGLVEETTYEAFLEEVEDENTTRGSAQTVYGVKDFSPQEYYSKRMSELTTQLQRTMLVNDAEVRERFDADRAAWSENATTYAYTALVLPASARPEKVTDLDDITTNEKRLTKAEYSNGDTTGVNPHDQELSSILSTLSEGEISEPVIGAQEITYYQLDGKTVDEETAFEAYASRIRQVLSAEKLDALLEQRMGASDFTVDASAVDAIDAEDVQG
ncbi:hypothetical protein [Kineosporia babensis]|uniref:Uncharacterized protein n=1 Tax=Kineosporia babensis TaxID=499548 RepID=A0A9X1NJK8_9ACTN|nr:hypothetical protein [Kineosporia babensis]MCD5314764.1 hypothetical protein [Kineosporia babensis]